MAHSGIEADVDDVVITAGATQGFAIAARLFCDPGDAVALESPTYPWAFATLASLGVRAAPVPLAADGLDLDRLDATLARGGVRLIYTMPSFHNPTGTSTELAHRKRLLEIAGRHGVPILEDDFEKDLRVRGRGAPPLRALDRRGLVAYLGTFSKSLFPAARVGWLILPRAMASAAVLAKRTMDLTTSPIVQAGLAQFLAEGSYDRHLRQTRAELEARLACAERGLAKHLPEGSTFSRPGRRLPDLGDAARLDRLERAARRGANARASCTRRASSTTPMAGAARRCAFRWRRRRYPRSSAASGFWARSRARRCRAVRKRARAPEVVHV